MGQIRKINGVYYIEFHARGLLYSQVAGNNLEEAQKLLLRVEEKIAGGEALTITRHIDLPDFYERFLSEARVQYSPQSVKRFTSTIKHFSGFLDENFPQVRQLAQLTPVIIESYKAYLIAMPFPKVSHMSFPNHDLHRRSSAIGNPGMASSRGIKIVNLTILLIRDILEFGIKLGFLNDNPSLHVRLLPWPTALERRPTVRYNKARQLLSKGLGLGKLSQLLKLPDVSRALYYANLIPLSREDVYS